MLIIADIVYSLNKKKDIKKEMIDSIYKIEGEIRKNKPLKLRRLGGEIIKTPNVVKYKFFEDKLIVESICTRYEFKVIYD